MPLFPTPVALCPLMQLKDECMRKVILLSCSIDVATTSASKTSASVAVHRKSLGLCRSAALSRCIGWCHCAQEVLAVRTLNVDRLYNLARLFAHCREATERQVFGRDGLSAQRRGIRTSSLRLDH